MTRDDTMFNPADLADRAPSGAEWQAWAAANPAEAAEVEIARRVRGLLRELNLAAIAVPEGFEERLLARIREDRTLLDLLDLGLSGLGRALLELIDALLGLLPAPPAAAPVPAAP